MSNERVLTFGAALNEALATAMARDGKVVLLGEDIGAWGGRFHVTEGLAKKFGEKRVIETPLVEEMLVGIGMGLSFGGYLPVIELSYGAFLALAIDDIYRAATWRFRYPPSVSLPLIIRIISGAYDGRGQEFGAHLMAWSQHIPGITVVSPSTPHDAKGLLIAALESNRPILFFEDKAAHFLSGPVPKETYVVPLGSAAVVREGSSVTLIGCGHMTRLALEAADHLFREQISAEVIDVRTLVPLDKDLLMRSVRKTRRVVIVEQGILRGGIGAEIGATLLEAQDGIRLRRVGAPNVPPAPLLWERFTLPFSNNIVKAVKSII